MPDYGQRDRGCFIFVTIDVVHIVAIVVTNNNLWKYKCQYDCVQEVALKTWAHNIFCYKGNQTLRVE